MFSYLLVYIITRVALVLGNFSTFQASKLFQNSEYRFMKLICYYCLLKFLVFCVWTKVSHLLWVDSFEHGYKLEDQHYCFLNKWTVSAGGCYNAICRKVNFKSCDLTYPLCHTLCITLCVDNFQLCIYSWEKPFISKLTPSNFNSCWCLTRILSPERQALPSSFPSLR